MKKGKLIVIDGAKGSGKSTLVAHFKQIYPNFIFTREPGGTDFAEKIREMVMSEFARQADAITHFNLVWASRADLVKNLIAPRRLNGEHVISDRFDSSTYAYQICAQKSHHLHDLFFQMRDIVLSEHKPDLYIILDVDPTEADRRANARIRENSHFHDKEIEYFERVRNGYLDFSKKVPNCVIVDANRSFEEVSGEIKALIDHETT